MKPQPARQWTLGDTDLLERVTADLDSAEKFFNSNIRDEIITRYRLVHADKDYYKEKFPRLSQKSSIVSTDIADTIEWILPSLMRIFWGGSDIVSIKGVTPEDKPDAMQALINWQVQRKNPGFMATMQWLRDALESGLGILKCWWVRDFENYHEEAVISAEQFITMDPKIIADARAMPNGLYYVKIKTTRMILNQPRLKNIPASEYLYSPILDDSGMSPFVTHRRLVTEDELRRKERLGIYKGIDIGMPEASIQYYKEYYDLDRYIRGFAANYATTDGFDAPKEDARKRYLLEETFAQYDVNGDGMVENVIVTKLGKTIIRKDFNEYGRPPFHEISTLPRGYQKWGRGVADLLQDMQDLKTALLRQIIVNVAQNNDRKALIESSQSAAIDDLAKDRNYIRIKDVDGRGVSNFIGYFPHDQLSPETFTLLETLQAAIENKTGVTRYNQGLDANSLNKTATGISQIMSASQQRIELIARICAETGFVDLYRGLVGMNQKWMDQPTVIRLTNQYLQIRPDDLQGEFDFEVSAGVGTGTKEKAIQELMLLLNNILPQLMPMQIVGPQEIYNVAKKLIEEMGYKNTTDFLKDPAPMIAMAQAMMQQQAMAAQGKGKGNPQGGQVPPGAMPPNPMMMQGIGGQPGMMEQPQPTEGEPGSNNF